MNSDESVCCVRVPTKNEESFYRIKTVWCEATFIITLLDNLNAFQTKVTQDEMKQQSSKYERDLHEYIQLLKDSTSELNDSYVYNRKDDFFYIYKQENAITIQIADFLLDTMTYDVAITEFIDDISLVADKYKKEIFNYKKESLKAIQEKNDYALKIQKYITLKRDSEHDLYSKFLLLLNEKKMRIQYLQEMLESFDAGQTIKINKMEMDKKLCSNRLETISDSDSVTDSNSSIDESIQQVTHQVQIEMSPKKTKLDFMDDDDDKLVSVLPKRMKIAPITRDLDEITTAVPLPVPVPDCSIPISTGNHFKLPKQLEKIEEANEHLDDSFEFSSQDLFDRL